MSSRSFRSVFMVASCAGAALSCYLVSLRVASERAQLEDVETKIVLAQRDMRVLQTEIGTRGRLSQLERWNAGAFALAAPAADQFVKGGFELARLAAPDHKPDFKAPVILASAPVQPKRPLLAEPETDDSGAPTAATPGALLRQASFKIDTREVPAPSAVPLPRAAAKSKDQPAIAAKPAHKASIGKSGLAAAHSIKKPAAKRAAETADTARNLTQPTGKKKTVDKARVVTAKALTKPVRVAKVDPLAPLPSRHFGNSKATSAER
ncbi:MAG TPA: hypothetical protein VE968_04895 [Sphingomicrobium sp.]|nr:hypothetical protein [Sphingomicrobium sp.]